MSKIQEKKLISIIIPTHNRSTLLWRAVTSIKNQKKNEVIEVIVVSDSIDFETDKVCASLLSNDDIYIRRNGLQGPSQSRNMGLDVASGEYIIFLDDDDSWCDGFISELLGKILIHPQKSMYFNCSIVKESRGTKNPILISETALNNEGRLTSSVFIKNQVHMSCFAFNANSIKGLRFDPYMRAYEDWDFQLFAISKDFPVYVNIMGSKIHEVDDETTDRRGSSEDAKNMHAVLDYIYVYRRHPVSDDLIRNGRQKLIENVGFSIDKNYL